MEYTFHYQPFSRKSTRAFKPFVTDLTNLLDKTPAVTTEAAYNEVLAQIDTCITNYQSLFTAHSSLYKTEMLGIDKKKALTEATPWGGVALKKVDVAKDYIQKLLVIGRRGILGFEIHDMKHEHLKVLEGICLFIHSVHKEPDFEPGAVCVSLVQPGDTITLLPGDEHGMIALTDCVVQETSTNHLDDLIFLFNSQQRM